MRKKISIVFLIIGLIFLASPKIMEIYIKHNNNKIIMNDTSADNISKNNSEDINIDYKPKTKVIEEIEDVSVSAVLKNMNNYNKDEIIGVLIIPDINLELPIFKGVTNANLMAGAVTMKDGLIMGSGNYSLAGHYMKNKSLLFGGLMDLEVGAKVFVTDKTKIYEYQIFENTIVPDTALYMLDDSIADQHGKPIISLMTCYYSSSTQKRYFSIGELISVKNVDEVN